MAKQPTAKQLEVLQYMCQGWELGCSVGWGNNRDRWRLQNGGIGKGGDTKVVRANVASNLAIHKLIATTSTYTHAKKYRLTEAGIAIAKERGWVK